MITHNAFVLTRSTGLPDMREVCARFAELAPGDSALRVAKGAVRHGDATAVFIFKGIGEVQLLAVPGQVPGDEAVAAVEQGVSFLDSPWTLGEYNAHLAVILDERDAATSPVNVLWAFTRVVAAVTLATDAVGIYWGNAGVTHKPTFFVDTARDPTLPVMLWNGVSVAQEGEGRISLLSLGMRQLDLPDLLVTAPEDDEQDQLLDFFFDMLCYVAQRGVALAAGETVGRVTDERCPVFVEPSPVDPDQTVMRVDLGC